MKRITRLPTNQISKLSKMNDKAIKLIRGDNVVSKNPPLTNRPPAPPSSSPKQCAHEYKVLNSNLYRATFYCSKCLEIRSKEL